VEHGAQVVVGTTRFADDLTMLTERLGFRIDVIHPADAPANAVVSGHGLHLRLEQRDGPSPVTVRLITDEPGDTVILPGGSRLEYRAATSTYELPDNRPSVAVTRRSDDVGVGRAGMRYRDLIPDRWGGRFIASHITIPDEGPVPDYVHFHKIRFQMIFVKAGWARLVYEDQGEPFVMRAGDCVLQPPQIRHRVLESSAGLEVIEIGCPAEHETIADWSLELPTATVEPDRDFGGQRFVRHVAEGAASAPWRVDGWEHRDTGIGEATDGLAGARVARPTTAAGFENARWIEHDTEFAQLVVLDGSVTIDIDGFEPTRMGDADSVAIPGGVRYRLSEPSADCELLDVTLPAQFEIDAATAQGV
jgi:mannose-6-phosphate isomerase-like protein (cupin superfamily)